MAAVRAGAANDLNSPQLVAALATVWEKSLPLLRQRVQVLQQAMRELRAGTLHPVLQEAGAGEAHRLAGLLGTFGYPEGTDAARLLEQSLDAPVLDTSPAMLDRLDAAVAALHGIVCEAGDVSPACQAAEAIVVDDALL